MRTESSTTRYMAQVRRLPRLERERESELARRWRDERDREAADALVEAHLGVAVAVAVKYRHYGVPIDELIAEGNMGLLQALERFDPDRGFRFVTYASYWVRARVVHHVLKSWSIVRSGSGVLRSKVFFKLRRERARIASLLGEGEAAEEVLAKKLEVDREQLRSMLQRLDAPDVSLDREVFDGSAATLVETLPSAGPSAEEECAERQAQDNVSGVVREALEGLDERERFVVEHRLMADEELSLAEIGRTLGVSRERARQLEARAKAKLRRRIRHLARGAGDDVYERMEAHRRREAMAA